jgi:hypothetical protein
VRLTTPATLTVYISPRLSNGGGAVPVAALPRLTPFDVNGDDALARLHMPAHGADAPVEVTFQT